MLIEEAATVFGGNADDVGVSRAGLVAMLAVAGTGIALSVGLTLGSIWSLISGHSEIQISEGETPLHRLETVYRRIIERLSTADNQAGAFPALVERWFFVLEEREKETRRAPSNGTPNFMAAFESIANDVPDADWGKVPVDLSKNLDHYLYGGQKTS